MPKTKFQNVIFTLMMAFLMVYAMICYNISLNIGGMSNQVFLMAFGEMKIMWPVAFVLEFFIVDNLAHKLAFRIVTPKDRPFAITAAISIMIICIMCPVMSLIATILFKNAGSQFVAVLEPTPLHLNFQMNGRLQKILKPAKATQNQLLQKLPKRTQAKLNSRPTASRAEPPLSGSTTPKSRSTWTAAPLTSLPTYSPVKIPLPCA